MNTSTPVDSRRRRETASSPLEQPSPLLNEDLGLSPAFILEGSDHLDHAQNTSQQPPQPLGSPTGTSLDMEKTKLSLTQVSETSLDRDIGANALMDVATRVGILYTCQPQEQVAREDECEVSLLVRALIDGLDISSWSSNPSFGNVDSSMACSLHDSGAKDSLNEPEPVVIKTGSSVEVSDQKMQDPSQGILESSSHVVKEQEDDGGDELTSPLPGSLNGATDTFSPLTPGLMHIIKRRLEFGNDLTPEVGRQRAVPEASSSKRCLDLSPDNEEVGTPKRRFSVGTYVDKSDRPKPNVIEALMSKEKFRSHSSPATPRRRRRKQSTTCDGRQRSIKVMWTRDKEGEKSNNCGSPKPKSTDVQEGKDFLKEKSSD